MFSTIMKALSKAYRACMPECIARHVQANAVAAIAALVRDVSASLHISLMNHWWLSSTV